MSLMSRLSWHIALGLALLSWSAADALRELAYVVEEEADVEPSDTFCTDHMKEQIGFAEKKDISYGWIKKTMKPFIKCPPGKKMYVVEEFERSAAKSGNESTRVEYKVFEAKVKKDGWYKCNWCDRKHPCKCADRYELPEFIKNRREFFEGYSTEAEDEAEDE
eukprot:TRINITY_DN27745_c0_g1_i1.p1 TRINITY_DN27745_c0_g1~~TRINITY_DN27745_c0_g1_i1.p1  ORF type:complete len:176 (+),score=44.74 TRINITY_DN27745_c0_g1_i1:42-530(+)